MTAGPGAVAAAALLVAAAGCAPIAAYRGPRPAPGAIAAFASRGAVGVVEPSPGACALGGHPDLARHHLGTIVATAPESLVVLVYGDNRPGLHAETQRFGFPQVKRMAMRRPGTWPLGLAALPVFLVRAVLPALGGFQDLVTLEITHRPRGGGEHRVLKALGAVPSQLVVSTGDLVTDGRRGRHWEDFVRRHEALRRRTIYLAAPGNHERTWSDVARANWEAAMGAPAAPRRYWFSVDLAGGLARFVFLDSNVLVRGRGRLPDSLQAALAEEQLAWADSALAGRARYRFVVMHHPLVTTGHYDSDWGREGDADAAAARQARVLALCLRRGVTALFAGHEHLYARLRLATPEGAGFWHVTTGGAGAPLYPIRRAAHKAQLRRPLPDGLRPEAGSVFARTTYHFCRLVLPATGRGTARLDVYEANLTGHRLLDRISLPSAEVP